MKVNENCDIFLGDCFYLFDTLNDNSVDLVLCDPPYNIGIDSWDKNFNYNLLCKHVNRVLKRGGNFIVFQGYSNICEMKKIADMYFCLQDWIIYDRIKGRGAKKHLVSTREDILWYSKGENYTFNKVSSNIKKVTKGLGLKNGNEYRALSNVWTDISPIVPWSKEKVKHPTQKPLKLIDRCINIWSNENDLILDPTMGSGTCAVSCVKNNRKFIGFEINKEYFDISKNRIEKALKEIDDESK